MTALGELPETGWVEALNADGKVDPKAQVADLTGILRHGPDGDRMEGWPPDQRVIVRRTPDPRANPPSWANTPTGSTGRSPPTPRPGNCSGWTPATAPRLTSRTR